MAAEEEHALRSRQAGHELESSWPIEPILRQREMGATRLAIGSQPLDVSTEPWVATFWM
jgi:hypothetical protein